MLLKFVNDSDRSIYAFEMLPPPAIDVPDDIVGQEFSSDNCIANNTVTVVPKSSSQPTDVLHTCDIVNDLLLCATESNRNQSPVNDGFCANDDGDQLNNRMESSLSGTVGDVALLESNPDVNWQHNQLSDMATDDNLQPCDDFVGNGMWASCLLPSETGCCTGDGEQCAAANGHIAGQAETMSSSVSLQTEYKTCAPEERQTEDGGGDAETSRVADEWKSCAICLEDMEDDKLLVHAHCGGTLCPDCHGVHFDLLIAVM